MCPALRYKRSCVYSELTVVQLVVESGGFKMLLTPSHSTLRLSPGWHETPKAQFVSFKSACDDLSAHQKSPRRALLAAHCH